MAFEIFLIANGAASPDDTATALQAALARTGASVLLVAAPPEAEDDDPAYRARVERLIPIAQAAGCAVLVDNRPHLVRATGADGVHMSGGLRALRDAIASLKPDFIVGTGDIGSRHEAMVRGELDLDYLMFGDRDDIEGPEMARWWAQTFEVPSVYLTTGAGETAEPGTEFMAYGEADWSLAPERAGARP